MHICVFLYECVSMSLCAYTGTALIACDKASWENVEDIRGHHGAPALSSHNDSF